MHSKTMVQLRSHSKVQLSVDFTHLTKVTKKSVFWSCLPGSLQKVNGKNVFKRDTKLCNFT